MLTCDAIPKLRLVPEREESFPTSSGFAGARNLQDLTRLKVRARQCARVRSKGAVVAHIAA